MPQAVNVGTALMLLGIAQVLRSPIGRQLIADVNLAILGVVEGQALEFELATRPSPTTADWTRMARGKTGDLFGACFIAGARAAGLDSAESDEVQRLGCDFGVFFQLQDDVLDLVGDKGRDVVASDLAEGKVSWPVAWLASHVASAERDRLMQIVRAPRHETSPAMVAEALAILHRSGAILAATDELARMARALAEAPFARVVPGLVERVLGPIGHVVQVPPLGA
jgi:geranylgeranyl pyrophosphate synthase